MCCEYLLPYLPDYNTIQLLFPARWFRYFLHSSAVVVWYSASLRVQKISKSSLGGLGTAAMCNLVLSCSVIFSNDLPLMCYISTVTVTICSCLLQNSLSGHTKRYIIVIILPQTGIVVLFVFCSTYNGSIFAIFYFTSMSMIVWQTADLVFMLFEICIPMAHMVWFDVNKQTNKLDGILFWVPHFSLHVHHYGRCCKETTCSWIQSQEAGVSKSEKVLTLHPPIYLWTWIWIGCDKAPHRSKTRMS